jgi:RHS repeat-associated protein
MTSLSSAPTGSKEKLDFVYDCMGRRIQKTVSTNNGSAYVGQSTNRYIYDGWNLLTELVPGGALARSYLWGSDLSGMPQSAGGVGGLLEVAYYGSSTTNAFPAYDGNGNVAALINAADGKTVAAYEYGPFGEVIRATGPMAKLNPFRFSTKYDDDETDQLYYGYRYYNPSTGRWLSRDPIEENGGLNIYAFVKNNPIIAVDICGLDDDDPTPAYIPLPNYNPPDAGKPCCYKSVTITATRTDKPPTPGIKFISPKSGLAQKWTINLSVALAISPGKFESLQIDWSTCIRLDGHFGYLASGLSTSFPTVTYGDVGGPYLTYARISWLSCDGGIWTIHQINAAGGYFFNGSWSHQGF